MIEARTVRIAHFSDLHVLSLAGVPPTRFLNKRFTGYLNLRLKRHHVHKTAYVRAIAREVKQAKIDHVVVTGDLTNLALEPEFRACAKLLASEAAWHAGEACLQTHGGFGFAAEYDVERKWREVRVMQVAPVSTNLILAHVAEHVLGLPRSY